MLFHFACGSLRRPAHNQLSHHPNTARSSSTVPLGCGQLRAGVALPVSSHTLYEGTPRETRIEGGDDRQEKITTEARRHGDHKYC